MVNGVDWEHVVEAIEEVALPQLNAVESYLRPVIAHLLKVHGLPACQTVEHWRTEIANFQQGALQHFVPSMRRKIDLDRVFERAVYQLLDVTVDGCSPIPGPETCPFTLDQLLNERRPALEAILAAAQTAAP
jgi:hypothetical protein